MKGGMDLHLLRHGLAEDRTTLDSRADSERRLTDAGRVKMRRIARTMRAAKLTFDVILSSPYLRARETAEIVARELRSLKRLQLSETLEPGGNPKDLIDELNGQHGQATSVLLVGHEPYLSRLASMLISGNTTARITMKKGGLCKLAVSDLHLGTCGTLEWLMQPRQMRRR
jgi:phosphohistidine phosphatase